MAALNMSAHATSRSLPISRNLPYTLGGGGVTSHDVARGFGLELHWASAVREGVCTENLGARLALLPWASPAPLTAPASHPHLHPHPHPRQLARSLTVRRRFRRGFSAQCRLVNRSPN